MFDNIIWDLDGTLLDTYPNMTKSFIKALKDYGVNEEYDKIFSLMKVSLNNAIEFSKKKYKVDDDILTKFRKYEKSVNMKEIRPFSYAKGICRDIIKNKKKNFLFTHRDNLALEYLKHHNMFQYFEGVVTSDKSFKRKPDPEGVNYIINKYNLKKEKTIMVGDRDLDIESAHNAGIKACLFYSGVVQDFDKADYNINSLKELYKIIGVI